MKTVYHNAESRGFASHGWLKTYHSFSFANYLNPERMHFGALRVLNDDSIAGGRGFGKHPHQNFEIITIPLEGDLKHADSMGHEGIIRKGEIQVMSAGKGVFHSEMNGNEEKEVKLLQIWIIPDRMNVEPRYDQKSFSEGKVKNDFQQILSPEASGQGVWIYQDAWFHWADFEKKLQKEYVIRKEGNGAYVFVIKGKIQIGNQVLGERDALGIWETSRFTIDTIEDAEFLIMDIPMKVNGMEE